MSATTVHDSGAMHPMSTETNPTPSNTQTQVHSVNAKCLFQTMETEQANEALEMSVFEGGESGRPQMTVNTPSGVKTAIVLGDTSSITTGPTSFQPEAKGLAEFENVWSEPVTKKMPATADDSRNYYEPVFNDRTTYLMRLFSSFFTHAVVRIMSKPPLYQSQRFWVAYVPDDAHSSFDSVGFEWNPSEQNELYVVLPWKAFKHMEDIGTTLKDVVGKISVIPVTPLVTATGLATQLEVSFMTCPLGLRTFTPKPVTVTRIVEAREEMEVFSENFVVKVKEQSDKVMDSSVNYTYKRKTNFDWICDLTWCFGMMTYLGQGIGKTKQEAKHRAAHAGWMEFLFRDPIARTMNVARPLCTSIEQSLRPRPPKYCCCKQCFELPAYAYDGMCRKCGNYNYCMCKCVSFPGSVIYAKEQIFEYSYTEPNSQAVLDAGASGDVSERQNRHWQRLETKVVKATDKTLTFDVKFKDIADRTTTVEAFRHAFVSGLPNLKLTSTTNPTSTATWRITGHDPAIAGDTMQYPGHEWDMKTGEHVFQPYWIYNTSLIESEALSVRITLKRLVGSHGSDYALSLWMNPTPLTYHHMKDREIESAIVAEEQGESYSEEASETTSEDVNQMTSSAASANQAETVGPVKSEIDWKLATTFKVDPNKFGIVDIPVEPALFGKYNWFNAKRYYKWKGTPRVKVMTTSASTTNAQVAIVHADKASVDGDDPALLPLMFPCAKASVNEAAVEMDLKWRKAQPTLPVRAGANDTLGYLKLCFVQGTEPLIADAKNEVQVSIFADVSNVEYSHPTNKVSEKWTKPTVSPRLRTLPTVNKISGPKIAVM